MADVLLAHFTRDQGQSRRRRVDGVAAGSSDDGGVVGGGPPAMESGGFHQLCAHMVDHAHPGSSDARVPPFSSKDREVLRALLSIRAY